MPSVSVIIPTFNRSRRLIRAIRSVLKQTCRDYEVIVVDDGSSDDTYQALAPYMTMIRYVRQEVNRGVSAARNSGIRRAAAPWIAFLDSDDYWLEDKLSVQIAFLERNPSALACQTEEIWIRDGRRVNPRKRHKKPSGDIFAQSLKLCLVSPSSVMLKSSLLDEIGLFDESLPAAEDYDLWLRISCRYPVYLIDKALVVKEGGHDDQLSRGFVGMDRFRIKAIVKLLESGILTYGQQRVAMEELSSKCRIYGEGCMKREKKREGSFYLSLPGRVASGEEVLSELITISGLEG
ncbi:MAG: glycosyltransferase family 2 protein [Deltaproteobacteria bacterium]|nr:glycosyltransferase family 2 protein [Deltaproteobacteria bacterium]